jgi:DNA polymerase-4
LAKNQLAKKFGVTTGQAIWQAKQICPGLIAVKPNYDRYLQYSRLVGEIYQSYTDQVESFGIDESWLDVTGSLSLFGSGEDIANGIRKRVFEELGVTVSVGVSFNKVFAKLGSDFKKPDAVTVFTKDNYKETVWPLPVTDLLYVGRATGPKLAKCGIYTIGDLARFDPALLHSHLGKVGVVLHQYANGLDYSPVKRNTEDAPVVKSIGNSITAPRDLVTENDVWVVIAMLSESVASRLRDHGLKCKGVQIHVRGNDLDSFERQAKLETPTCLSTEISKLAMEIFREKAKFDRPLRSLGVRAIDLVPANRNVQMSFLYDYEKQRRMERLEETIDDLRGKFGHFAVQKGMMAASRDLGGHNAKEHTIHPVGLFSGPML